MKKYLILGIFIVALLLLTGWFVFSKKSTATPVATTNTTPQTNSTSPVATEQAPSSTIQEQTNSQQAIVENSFLEQIKNKNQITLYKTTVVSTYALQEWGGENTGGQALLKYYPSEGWSLITMGGGAWSVSALTDLGVPKPVAEQLISGSTR